MSETNLRNCPNCAVSLDGGEIPDNIKHNYSPPYRWGRQIGIYNTEKDRTVEWQCPDCGHRWPR